MNLANPWIKILLETWRWQLQFIILFKNDSCGYHFLVLFGEYFLVSGFLAVPLWKRVRALAAWTHHNYSRLIPARGTHLLKGCRACDLLIVQSIRWAYTPGHYHNRAAAAASGWQAAVCVRWWCARPIITPRNTLYAHDASAPVTPGPD